MALTKQSAWKAIEELQDVRRNGQFLELELRYAGKQELAEQVWSETKRLDHEIDLLIGKAIDQWLQQSEQLLTELSDAHDDLQARIDDIEETIQKADRVVKAIGYIDDAVAIAAKLAKYA